MRAVIAFTVVALFALASVVGGQSSPFPRVELIDVPSLRLPGTVDSNSPVVWEQIGSQNVLFIITSSSGAPSVAFGSRLDAMSAATPVAIEPWPDGGGIWIEAVIPDVDGTWYGYYHVEIPAVECGTPGKVIPRIGSLRSRDYGRTWEPLGIILEAPPNSEACSTPNQYFVGGVGDFSVQLDPEFHDLYFFYSAYPKNSRFQGVAVARLRWADRDAPAGRMMVWRGRYWAPAAAVRSDDQSLLGWKYAAGFPILAPSQPWHDEDPTVDAFWGPSVHWNTYLQQYVMLLNRAKDSQFNEEGIYISYAPRLDDPRLWTPPVKIVNGGRWYPQVIGEETGSGTDRTAGQWARFFDLGVSRQVIRFTK